MSDSCELARLEAPTITMSSKKRKVDDLKALADTSLALMRAKQTMVTKMADMIKSETNAKVVDALERALVAAYEAFDDPPPPFDHK